LFAFQNSIVIVPLEWWIGRDTQYTRTAVMLTVSSKETPRHDTVGVSTDHDRANVLTRF